MDKAKIQQQAIKKVAPDSVPEVKRFLDAQDRIRHFKEEHAEVFNHLEPLVEEYNAALEAADKVLRAQRLSSGPFDLYSIKCTYNAEKLYNELGEDDFIKAGGSLKKITKYELNEALFEALAERGSLPEEVVKAVRTLSPNFHKPHKLDVP